MCSLLKELAPITHWTGFVEAPITILDEFVVPWRKSLDHKVTMERVELPLRDALRKLDPLTSWSTKELWVETWSSWLACFTNHLQGGYGPVSYLAEQCKTRAVVISSSPFTMPNRPTKETKGNWGSVQFSLFGPKKTDFLNYIRSIAAANDGGRWVFQAAGEVQSFEQTDRYLAPRKKDRFTPEMLESYCRALGIDPFNEAFYKPSAVLMTDIPPSPSGRAPRTVSLADQRRDLGFDP
jgi:hypothetical protein